MSNFVEDIKAKITSLRTAVTGKLEEKDAEISGLETIVADKDAEISGLETILAETYDNPSAVSFAYDIFECRKASTDISYMFAMCDALTTVPLFDTSKVTIVSSMFYWCKALTTVPLFDTSKVIIMSSMFANCNALTTVPLFDTSNVTTMSQMFGSCVALTTVPLFDTSNVTNMSQMFSSCVALTTVPLFDTSKVTNMNNIFNKCTSLTDCYLRNIKTTLQVGSGTSWGHLLTLDSLKHLIYELRDTGSIKTLTVGSANLEKLADVYVKTVDITDEMRAEDDLIDEKLPYEVCESTVEGAMLITNYALLKNWSIL